MRPHTPARGRHASSTPSRSGRASTAGAGPPDGLRRRRVLPAGRARPAPGGATTRATPSTRTASAWPGPSPSPSRGPRQAGPGGVRHGFFASVDAAPAEGYRAPRLRDRPGGDRRPPGHRPHRRPTAPASWRPCVAGHPRHDVALRAVPNDFFGGNIGVAGLLTGEDLARALAERRPTGTRCLLPDACLNEGRFLDGLTLADLPRPVEVVPTDGALAAPRARRHLVPTRLRGMSPDGRGGRPAQRRQVVPGEPDRRRAGGRGRGGAGGHPRPQGARRPSGPACRSRSWTPAAGWPAATPSRPR